MFCFSQLSEVKETSEFEKSRTALSQLKGSLRGHVEFWRSVGALHICEAYRLRFLDNYTWVYLPKY